MIRKTFVLTAIGVIVVGIALAGFHQGGDALDPVKVAPDSHKIAFETHVRAGAGGAASPPGASSHGTAIRTA